MTGPAGRRGPTAKTGGFRAVGHFRLAAWLPEATHVTVPAGRHGPTARTGGFRTVDCFRLAARLPEATHVTGPAGRRGPTANTGDCRAAGHFRLAARPPEATHVTGPAARWWADGRNGWLPGGRPLPSGGQAAGSHPRHGSSGTLVGKLHKEQAMFLAGGTPAFSLTIGTEKGNLLHREHIWLGGKFP